MTTVKTQSIIGTCTHVPKCGESMFVSVIFSGKGALQWESGRVNFLCDLLFFFFFFFSFFTTQNSHSFALIKNDGVGIPIVAQW